MLDRRTLARAFDATRPVETFLTIAGLLTRWEVEEAVEALIERLDAADGDADREDDDPDTCQAGDDGCAPFMTFYGPRWGADTFEPAAA